MNDDRSKKAPEALDDEALGAVTGGSGSGVWTVTCDCGAEWSVPKGTLETICTQCGQRYRLNSNGFRVPCFDY